jgi:hypothetical protein
MSSETNGLSKENHDEQYRQWLASEIKKKLSEKKWPEYEALIRISRKIVYEAEKKRLRR